MSTSAAMFRIGQVAKLTGASVYHIRRLCEYGLIPGAEQTAGGWYVPASEAERLKHNLPPIPAPPPPAQTQAPKSPASASPALTRDPNRGSRPQSEDLAGVDGKEAISRLVDAALKETGATPGEFGVELSDDQSPDVRAELDGVQIEAARLQRRKIQLRAEEVEDQFRARDAARAADVQRAREKQARQLAEAARIEWRNRWLKYALDRVPYNASPSLRIQANDAVTQLLDTKLSPDHSKQVIEQLADAAVNIVLEPYHRERHLRDSVESAIHDLPSDLYWHLRRSDVHMNSAKQMARDAIKALSSSATDAQMKAAAASALQPLRIAFEHEAVKRRVIDGLRNWRSGYGDDRADEHERAGAIQAVTQALEACPPGTAPVELEKTKAQTLIGIDKQVETRIRNDRAARSADRALDRYLYECILESNAFPDWRERDAATARFRDGLRPVLMAAFLDGSLRETTDGRPIVEQYVDAYARAKPKEARK